MKIQTNIDSVIILKCQVFGKVIKINVKSEELQGYLNLNYATIDFDFNTGDECCEKYDLYGFVTKPVYDMEEHMWATNEDGDDYEKLGTVTELENCYKNIENSICQIEWL